MHIPDVFVLKPIFHEGERWPCRDHLPSDGHGGRWRASNASDSTEIYQKAPHSAGEVYDAGSRTRRCPAAREDIRMPTRVSGT